MDDSDARPAASQRRQRCVDSLFLLWRRRHTVPADAGEAARQLWPLLTCLDDTLPQWLDALLSLEPGASGPTTSTLALVDELVAVRSGLFLAAAQTTSTVLSRRSSFSSSSSQSLFRTQHR